LYESISGQNITPGLPEQNLEGRALNWSFALISAFLFYYDHRGPA